MQCDLCLNEIENYNASFNQLKIDEIRVVYICQDCVTKFIKWQQSIYATLYPTKQMKRRYKKREIE